MMDAALVHVYYEKRGLDMDLILTLETCSFIEKNQPVVLNGFTGSGKSPENILAINCSTYSS